MFAAKTTAARRGLRRRPAALLLAAIAAASLTLGSGSSTVVFGAKPDGTNKPGATPTATPVATPPAKGDNGSQKPKPEPSASPAPTASPAPEPSTDPVSKPDPTPKASPDAPLTADEQRIENVIAAAKQYIGIPYRVGSEGPFLFDCSGLVFRAFSDAGLVDRIGGARLRAAGYMHWFASRGRMTTDESQAQRGDLVIYNNGTHIGIYLGDGRTISALINPWGVTVHSLHGVSEPVTSFLRPDWSGDGKVAPFVPVAAPDGPDVPEVPATLVPGADWMPTLDPAIVAPQVREGTERVDLRTVNSRTFQNTDGTFTTEFHAQPIYYQPAGTTSAADLQPINLSFVPDDKTGYASVDTSPVTVTTRPANDAAGFVSATFGDRSVSLSLAQAAGTPASKAVPQVLEGGRGVDYFDFQPQAVGLRVLAQTDGFKTFLVMSKQPDNTRFSYVLDAPGLTPTLADDGSIVLTDETGATLGRIAQPLLLDSSDIDGNGGGVFTAATTLSLDTSGDKPVITVSIDHSYLDEAVYPAYVDMSLTDFPSTDAADVAFASSAHPNASLHDFQRPESAGFNELWLGHQPNSTNNNEVYVRFAGLQSLLGTVDVASASLELLPYFQRANDGVTIVHRLSADWSAENVTWLTKPLTDDTDPLTITSAPATWSSLDVSSYVTDVLSKGQEDYGLALAGDESTTGTWKRLAASDAGDAAEFGPRLVVTWSGLRPVAAAVAPVTDSARPVPLTWTQPQIVSGDQLRFEVQVSHDNFATTDVDSGTVKGASGKQMQWTVPSRTLKKSGAYTFRVRVKYGTDKTWSAWSAGQIFTVSFARTYTVRPDSNLL